MLSSLISSRSTAQTFIVNQASKSLTQRKVSNSSRSVLTVRGSNAPGSKVLTRCLLGGAGLFMASYEPSEDSAIFKMIQCLVGTKRAAECCGIVGYIGNKPIAGEVCIQGLQILESRGYDSCGLVTIDENGQFVRTKFASSDRFGGDCIKRMALEGGSRHKHCIGIGHTRWAKLNTKSLNCANKITHGDKTDVNAHPHYDQHARVALVHNGIIENCYQLKGELLEKYGIQPVSQTDTEIVALWIGVFLDQGLQLGAAISKCVEILEGAYSFVLISTLEPDAMQTNNLQIEIFIIVYIVKNTGTMVIGVAKELEMGAQNPPLEQIVEEDAFHPIQDDIDAIKNSRKDSSSTRITSDSEEETGVTIPQGSAPLIREAPHLFQIVASDTTVFQDYTKQFYSIGDKEIIRISLKDKVETTKLQVLKEQRVEIRKPPGVDHYYVMEMDAMPEAICNALNHGARFKQGPEPLVKLGGLDDNED